MPRTVRIIFSGHLSSILLRKMPDVHVDDIREAVVIHVRDMFESWCGSAASRDTHQIFQDTEFLWREFHIFARTRHLASNAIERQFAHLQTFRASATAAQQHTHSRQQFDERNGFTR